MRLNSDAGKILGNGKLSKLDINKLELKVDYSYKELFNKYNKLLKVVRGNDTDRRYYVWSVKKKLWQVADRAEVYRVIYQTIENLFDRVIIHSQLSVRKVHKIRKKCQISGFIKCIKTGLVTEDEDAFADKLDNVDVYFPILNGKKIKLTTKEVTERTITDYFTFEFKCNYLDNLSDEDNMYGKYIRSLWNTKEEYDFHRMIHGMLITPDHHHNYCINWVQLKGGSGKTIFAICAQTVFTKEKVLTLPRRLFNHNSANNRGFGLSRMKDKFFVIIEEASDHQIGSKASQQLDIRLICELTGGGFNNEQAKYQKGSDTEGKLYTAKVFFMGNGIIGPKNNEPAWERRLLVLPQACYFRSADDKYYDECNEHCKLADDKLLDRLLAHPSHIFTYYINAGSDYIKAGYPNLKKCVPDVLKDRYNKILNGSIKINLVESASILNDFVMTSCYFGDEDKLSVYYDEFCDRFNLWLQDNGDYDENKWPKGKIRKVFNELCWNNYVKICRPGARGVISKIKMKGIDFV